ncbi:MAG: HesA/MoeB/ThiF family protein [Thiothrix sp.]
MNDAWLLRYSRQILLPEIDIRGQERLQAAKVLVIGMGGLGSPVALYLGAAGVGTLTLVDFDRVELSNLQRQIIHSSARLGQNKADSAAQAVAALNPEVTVQTLSHRLAIAELQSLVDSHDAVVDCSDNFPTRFHLNLACKIAGKPLISGAVMRFAGQITTFDFRQADSPCYRCLYDEDAMEEDEDTCSTSGILAPVAGTIGSMQATETLKALLNLPTLNGRLLQLDAKQMRWRESQLPRDPACPVCRATASTRR